MIKLYELVGEDVERRFSPYCWRIVMALAHKGLAYESIPVRFTEKNSLAFSGQGMVPVLVDGDRVVTDSWNIAGYLEEQYPERPALFGCEAARGEAMFIKQWCERVVQLLALKIVALDIVQYLGPADAEYFRDSRARRFGMPLEAFTANREETLAQFRQAISPLRATLQQQPFLCGEAAAFADYIVFGAFQWARVISSFELLEADDPVWAWRERMLDLFGGQGRQVKAAADGT